MRNVYLDNAKWILTLLMVLYHIQFVGEPKYESTFMWIKNLGDCVVPAFSVISGFLFWNTVKNFSDLKYKILRRISTLLIPYFLWNIINSILLNLIGGRTGISLFYVNPWNNIIMWESSPHFWYIFMLMFWTVLSPLLLLFYNKKGGVVILVTISLAYLYYKGDTVLHSRFIYILYVWAGAIGYYYPNLISKTKYKEGIKKKIMTIILALSYFGVYFIYCGGSLGMGIKVWIYGIRAIALLMILVNFPLLKIGISTGYRYSFWVFAVHYWLDSYIGGIIANVVNNVYIYQLLTWVIVVTIGLFTGIITDKKLPFLFRLLSGDRG